MTLTYSDSEGKKKKILVVDDDPGILKTLEFMLEEAGYEVMKNTDGETVENQIKKNIPDLILLDVWMPKINGSKLARQLKNHQATKNIPLILISAVSDSVKVVKDSGADDFLAKPFNMYDLLFLIKKYLEKDQNVSYLNI